MASPFVEIEVGPRTVKVTNPEKLSFPVAGITKMDVIDYYLAVGDGILRALRERPVTLERWQAGVQGGREGRDPGRRPRRRRVLPEAHQQGRPRVGRDLAHHVPQRTYGRRGVPHRAGHRHLVRAAEHHHVPPVAGAPRRRRPSRRAAHRPRPAAGHRLPRRGRGRCRRARGARRDRLARVPEDVGQQGRAHLRAHPAAVGVHRHPARGHRVRPRARAADARPGHDEVVEGGAGRDHLRRLQPERPRQNDRVGVLHPSPAARAGVGAVDVGRAARRRPARADGADDAGALRRAGRPARGDQRRRPRPDDAAGVVRARRARPRSRRHALPARLPEDAGGAEAGAAEPGHRPAARRSSRPTERGHRKVFGSRVSGLWRGTGSPSSRTSPVEDRRAPGESTVCRQGEPPCSLVQPGCWPHRSAWP